MGERRDDRKVINDNTRELMKSGVSRDKARKLARESMVRVDRDLRDQGKR